MEDSFLLLLPNTEMEEPGVSMQSNHGIHATPLSTLTKPFESFNVPYNELQMSVLWMVGIIRAIIV